MKFVSSRLDSTLIAPRYSTFYMYLRSTCNHCDDRVSHRVFGLGGKGAGCKYTNLFNQVSPALITPHWKVLGS